MDNAKKEDAQAVKYRHEAALRENLAITLHEVGPEAARPYAEELAELLGEEAQGSRVAWCDIWEARGRLDKAIEVGERPRKGVRLNKINVSVAIFYNNPMARRTQCSDSGDVYPVLNQAVRQTPTFDKSGDVWPPNARHLSTCAAWLAVTQTALALGSKWPFREWGRPEKI